MYKLCSRPRILFQAMATCLACFSLLCCERELEEVNIEQAYDYFPLAIGQNWEYEVDSITLRPALSGIIYDSVRLYAREVLVDSLADGAGQKWYVGERYERTHDSLPWQYRQTFALSLDASRAWRREDNLDFIKLSFPVQANKSWDGNAAFDAFRNIAVGGELIALFKGWSYSYTTVNEAGEVNGVFYDSLLTVVAADYENLIERRLVVERYARGVGLVYREIEAFDTQCRQCCNGNTSTCLDLPWRAKAEKGFILRQRLKPS